MSQRATAGRPPVWRYDTRETPARELYLLIQHVAGVQIQELGALLRPFAITPEQFHVLRVLGEAGETGLTCSAVAERSVSGDPDVTRLLDRLEKQGWVSRSRDPSDRRVVIARITAEGEALLETLDGPVSRLHARQFASMPRGDRAALRRLLHSLARAG